MSRNYIDFLVLKEDSGRIIPDIPDDGSPEDVLRAFEDGDWIARCGGDDGMGGDIESNNAHQYEFYYMCPKYFRMIIVTESGRVITTNALNPLLYNTTVTFDAAAGTLTEDAAAKCSGLLRAFGYTAEMLGITCFCTIAIEGVVMLLFFLKMNGHDWRVFLLTQFYTQILLYAMLYIGMQFGMNLYFLAELIIVIAEPVIYYKCFRTERRKRVAVAGVFANLISAALGLLPFVWIVIRALRGLP